VAATAAVTDKQGFKDMVSFLHVRQRIIQYGVPAAGYGSSSRCRRAGDAGAQAQQRLGTQHFQWQLESVRRSSLSCSRCMAYGFKHMVSVVLVQACTS
jgi:hypothetical protein